MWHDLLHSTARSVLKTAMCVDVAEFEHVTFSGPPTDVTFALREFKVRSGVLLCVSQSDHHTMCVSLLSRPCCHFVMPLRKKNSPCSSKSVVRPYSSRLMVLNLGAGCLVFCWPLTVTTVTAGIANQTFEASLVLATVQTGWGDSQPCAVVVFR